MSEERSPVPPSHEEIMQATHDALCKHGYADLTMRKIAAECSKSHSLLTYHYETKRNLILTYIEHIVCFLENETVRSESADPIERLDTVLDYYTVGTDVYPEELALALFEIEAMSYRDDEFRGLLREYHERELTILEGIIADGVERGVFRSDVDGTTFSKFVISTLIGASRHETAGGIDGIAHDVRQLLTSSVIPAILLADSRESIEST